MNLIQKYGWNDTLFQQKQNSQFSHLPHVRVTVVHKTCYEVITDEVEPSLLSNQSLLM